jgi:hypothetical protein
MIYLSLSVKFGEARVYFYLAFQGKVKLQIFSEYAYSSVKL